MIRLSILNPIMHYIAFWPVKQDPVGMEPKKIKFEYISHVIFIVDLFWPINVGNIFYKPNQT
jgi:hypothetical protein